MKKLSLENILKFILLLILGVLLCLTSALGGLFILLWNTFLLVCLAYLGSLIYNAVVEIKASATGESESSKARSSIYKSRLK